MDDSSPTAANTRNDNVDNDDEEQAGIRQQQQEEDGHVETAPMSSTDRAAAANTGNQSAPDADSVLVADVELVPPVVVATASGGVRDPTDSDILIPATLVVEEEEDDDEDDQEQEEPVGGVPSEPISELMVLEGQTLEEFRRQTAQSEPQEQPAAHEPATEVQANDPTKGRGQSSSRRRTSWSPILWIVLVVVLVLVVVIVVTTVLVLDQQDNGTTSASTGADTNPDGTNENNTGNDTVTNPTALPTPSPSWTPSSVPTQSLLPSVVPTTSLVPSSVPSSNPTQALGLDITMTNYLTGCVASTLNGVCTEPPFLTGFLFRGGDCAFNNFTSQPIQDYTCTDFPQNVGIYGGIPSLGSSESAYIVANADPGDAPGGSAGNALPPLFQGIVQEDSLYFLFDNRQPLPNRTQIRMWPANATVRDDSTLLQDVRFDSSCTNPLYILNVFGAHQVVFFQMPGLATAVSIYVATPICRMTIQVFVEARGEQAVTIANARALANLPLRKPRSFRTGRRVKPSVLLTWRPRR